MLESALQAFYIVPYKPFLGTIYLNTSFETPQAMLQELSIRNFAIIDDLKVSFSEGLTVLTGETGAGKSIILNAVNLLLGNRASSKLVRTGADAAELEALFMISADSPVNKVLSELQIDPSEGLLIRRIISRSEKHRNYINGRLATLQMLSQLTEPLASIAGQHAHQTLLKEDQHLLTLDQFAGLMPLRRSVHETYHTLVPLLKSLQALMSKQEKEAAQRELYEFQKKEIAAVNMQSGEDDILEQERLRLKNASFLAQTIHEGLNTLYNAPGAVVEKISGTCKAIEKAGQIDSALVGPCDRLGKLVFQIEDVVHEFQCYLDQIQHDETRLAEVEERLDQLNRLKRKYGGSLKAVLSYSERIDTELNGYDTLNVDIDDLQKKVDQCVANIGDMAGKLSEQRRYACKRLSQQVEKELRSLKMPHTRFDVLLEDHPCKTSALDRIQVKGKLCLDTGIDQAVFMIAPNKGEALKPLAAIASGGELSRVVLALKAILANNDDVESIVFDEVDAGIGGGTAEVVGQKLSTLSRSHQIICITHLPQIAKFADHHYKISKQVVDDRTQTFISPVKEKDRVQEIARMLGGTKITQATIDHAREMLENE